MIVTSVQIKTVKMQKHLYCPVFTKSIENFGFRCFFVGKTHFYVWVKMWVNRLTHTVTHTGKRSERAKDERTEKPLF